MSNASYYIMTATHSHLDKGMMLYSMPDLPDESNDDWMFGKAFNEDPEEPIKIGIQENYEDGTPLDYFGHPPIVSDAFYEALVEFGVDNIIAYQAVLVKENESIRLEGFKAINILGLVKAAGPGTVYMGDIYTISASIEKLDFDPTKVRGLYMFRMAKNFAHIFVHEELKRYLESKGFDELDFQAADGALLL